jgi:hypothetical protein
MTKLPRALLGTLIAFAVTISAAHAQTDAAEIVGDVVDLDGAPVPRAALIVTSVETTNERRLTADDRGRFMTTGLVPGEYHVTAAAPGFAPRRQEELVLAPNQRATVQLVLRRAAIPETLTVAEMPARLETARSDVHEAIEAEQLENLPNLHRDPLALSELVVATTTNPAGGDPRVMAHETSLNDYAVDGFNRKDSLTGASRVLAPLSAITAFDERINGYNAEADGAAGVFNIATRAGTNRLHGSLFDFFGDRSLNGLKTIDQATGIRAPYRSNQFGGVVGGPLVVSRDFFLVSYEGARETIAGGTSADFSPFVSPDPRSTAALAQLRDLATRQPRASDRDMWLLKANHEFNGGGTLRLQYAERRIDGAAVAAAGPAPVVATTGDIDVEARMFGALLGVAAGGFANEARVQYATDHDRETAGPPAVTVFEKGALVLRTGDSVLGPHDFTADRIQVNDTVSIANGAHAAKAGVEALLDQNSLNPNALARGSYVFRSLASFAGGIPGGAGESYTQTFATDGRNRSIDVRTYSAFVQDTWHLSSAATADFGVRYDAQVFTRGMPPDADNWAPRVGLAIRRGEHAVIRTGYGLYYGVTPAWIPAMTSLDGGLNTTTVTVRGPAAPAYPNLLTRIPAAPRSTTAVDAQFENAQIHQAHVGYEWEKYRVGTAGIAYVFARGTHLPRLVEADGRATFAGGRVAEYQSTGESLYNGLTMRGRLTRTALMFDVAYTFARMDATPFGVISVQPATIGDRSVLAQTAQERRAPGDDDHHHHLAASMVYDTTARAALYHGITRKLLQNWTLSFAYDVLSGAPYTAYADADLNGDGNLFNDVAPATSRNQYRLPWHITLNPRASRDFHFDNGASVSLIWQAFNVTNRPNYVAVDDMLYTLTATGLQRNPLFGRRTAQDEGRVMQLAAKVTF